MIGPGCRSVALGLAALACAFVVGCGTDDTSTGSDILGEWQGGLTENTGERFGIVLQISSLEVGKQAANVTYPGLGSDKGCSGNWRYQGKSGELYRLHETITSGRSDKCFGTGEVTLEPLAEKLRYRWRSGPNSSSGTIEHPG